MSELIDNSRHRIESLKEIIRRLHDGADPESLTSEFGDLLAEVGATEIAAMENSLMAEGMPQQEIQKMCDVHAAVLGSHLDDRMPQKVPAGHPVDTFRLENEVIVKIVDEYRGVVERLPVGVSEWSGVHNRLAAVDGHYRRKEYLIFPYLEKAGIAGPPKVMWGVHDEIREKIDAVGELLDAAPNLSAEDLALAASTVVEPMLDQIRSMVDKENKILWPMTLEHLSTQDWASIHDQWSEFGGGLAKPAAVWLPTLPQLPSSPVELPVDDMIRLPSGHFSLRQLTAVLNTLPMDVTFVDADDRVGFFTEGKERVFERNRAIIGRRVEDCHPPKSVHIVEQVVEDLRSGKRDVAEFWIEMQGRFIHIRYFPVRDDNGTFLGVLETTQDVTRPRALEGERRLLAEVSEGANA